MKIWKQKCDLKCCLDCRLSAQTFPFCFSYFLIMFTSHIILYLFKKHHVLLPPFNSGFHLLIWKHTKSAIFFIMDRQNIKKPEWLVPQNRFLQFKYIIYIIYIYNIIYTLYFSLVSSTLFFYFTVIYYHAMLGFFFLLMFSHIFRGRTPLCGPGAREHICESLNQGTSELTGRLDQVQKPAASLSQEIKS